MAHINVVLYTRIHEVVCKLRLFGIMWLKEDDVMQMKQVQT